MARSGLTREKVAAGVLGLLAMAAYNPNQTPLLRTGTSDTGCDCGTPGAGGGLQFTRRRLSLDSFKSPEETWLLPLNANVAFDFRGRHGIPLQMGGTYQSLAQSGAYRLGWAGDASSVLVAIEMPKNPLWTSYDFSSYQSGRVSPTLADVLAVAAGNGSKRNASPRPVLTA